MKIIWYRRARERGGEREGGRNDMILEGVALYGGVVS
jgi:hypothetical protein